MNHFHNAVLSAFADPDAWSVHPAFGNQFSCTLPIFGLAEEDVDDILDLVDPDCLIDISINDRDDLVTLRVEARFGALLQLKIADEMTAEANDADFWDAIRSIEMYDEAEMLDDEEDDAESYDEDDDFWYAGP